MSGRPVQHFSDEALAQGRRMSPDQVLRFLDDFRRLHAAPRALSSRLISLRVPEDLLTAFKARADMEGIAYQTQIKRLMRDWLSVDGD